MIEQKTINSLTHCPLFHRMSEMEIADALSCICHKIIPFKNTPSTPSQDSNTPMPTSYSTAR